ncbi:MAG: hypothetical protein EZS28_027184 [Streblomastix strix]|uniref:Uncharacterized protein n=1 Tax=Streblomastix strix TaxID=222440 RepID=A0A5J4V5B9_9EUKA|nr:MAG: hypothetical protein EZS28_027184 [Streblomastix strix]
MKPQESNKDRFNQVNRQNKQNSSSSSSSSSSIRGVCCYGYARIGGINVLCTLLVDVVLCRGLSTVYIAACSIY